MAIRGFFTRNERESPGLPSRGSISVQIGCRKNCIGVQFTEKGFSK